MIRSFILIFFFLSVRAFSQTPIWEYVNPNASHFIDLTVLRDSSIVMTGNWGNNSLPHYPTRITKYSMNGAFQWQFFGRTQYAGTGDIKELANGNLVYAASQHRFAAPSEPNKSDVFLQEMNSVNGDTLTTWSQTYTTPFETDIPTELLVMSNGDLVTAGMSVDREPGQGNFSYFVLHRTDSLGNTIWKYRYAKNACTYGTRLLLNSNGNFVLAGMNCRPNNVSPFHPFLMEISPTGDSISGKTLVIKSTANMEEISRGFNNIIQTSDGNYVFSGDFFAVNVAYTAFVAKVDTAFNLLWYYEDVPTTTANSRSGKVAELADSTLVFMAKDIDQVDPPYLIRLTQNGQFVSRTFLSSLVCPPNKLKPYDFAFLPDSSIALCGWCQENSQGYIGRFGNLSFPPVVGTAEQLPKLQVQLYPNPARQQVQVQLSGTATCGTLQLYSVTGQQVLQQRLTSAQTQVPLKGLPQGLYLYRIVADGQVVSGKLAVE